MRVVLKVEQEDNAVLFVNIDTIEEVVANPDGTYKLWTVQGTWLNISEEEFKRWKKFVEVI
jgi:hypothetical protein